MKSGGREGTLQLSVPQRKHTGSSVAHGLWVDARSSSCSYFFLLQLSQDVAQHNSFKLRAAWGAENLQC